MLLKYLLMFCKQFKKKVLLYNNNPFIKEFDKVLKIYIFILKNQKYFIKFEIIYFFN